jgi:hypothetical protein
MRRRRSDSCASSAPAAAFALIVAAALSPVARAAFESPWPDTRAAGLASFGLPSMVSPSGTASSAASSSGVTADEGRHVRVRMTGWELYGLSEARALRFAVESVGDPTLGLELSRFGSDVYEEHVVSLGVSRTVTGGATVELRLRALGLAAADIGEEWCAALDAGVGATLLERIQLSCRWDNLGGSSIRGSPVSSVGTVSASLAADRLTLVASALLEAGMEPSTSMGVEFEVVRGLSLRAGTATRPWLFAAGLGVTVPGGVPGFGGCVVDLAWQWHPELGGSSFASLSLCR